VPRQLTTDNSRRRGIKLLGGILFESKIMEIKTLKLNEDQRDRHDIINGPIWLDGCNHPTESYVCSYKVEHGPREIKQYDLYLFPHPYHGSEVCIRYGNELDEYLSQGSVADLFFHIGGHWRNIPETLRAAEILREFFKFELTVRTK
jgi:hypothetical protein